MKANFNVTGNTRKELVGIIGNAVGMKPVALVSYPIMNSTMTGCLVLDPFGGSGSTLIACEQTGRVCYTVELDEKFCDVIVNRYRDQVGTAAKITCQRDGLTYTYDEIQKLTEPSE